MLQVGLNENVSLLNATKNEKGTLVLTYESMDGGSGSNGPIDVFEAMQEGVEHDFGGNTHQFMLFPPSATNNKNEPNKPDQIEADVNNLKNQLTHILSQYRTMTASPDGSTPAFRWKMYENTGITDLESMRRGLKNQAVLTQIYNNLVNQFLEEIEPYLGSKTNLFRLLLLRRSKDKHFPTLRSKYIADNPFLESMDVPVEETKLKFTAWEIKQGLDNDTPIAAPAGGAGASVPTAATGGAALPFAAPAKAAGGFGASPFGAR